MILVENITDWRGQDVIDSVGEKLGKLEHVYFDGETDDPSFIGVKSGTFSKSLTLVPLTEASVGRDYVRVNRAKGDVKKAPSYDTDVELTLDDEAATFKHYGLEYTPAGAGARRLAKR
jgi:PRC-barrel domain